MPSGMPQFQAASGSNVFVADARAVDPEPCVAVHAAARSAAEAARAARTLVFMKPLP
jgi:hypothetical protein